MARVARIASEAEERARASWAEANQRVMTVDRERETALDNAGRLAAQELPIGLRSHLTGAGARHLMALADQKVDLVTDVEERQAELQEAVTKVKSLERLVERIDDEEAERRKRFDAADLQDMVAIRAAREAS